jgi:hypothetical protein
MDCSVRCATIVDLTLRVRVVSRKRYFDVGVTGMIAVNGRKGAAEGGTGCQSRDSVPRLRLPSTEGTQLDSPGRSPGYADQRKCVALKGRDPSRRVTPFQGYIPSHLTSPGLRPGLSNDAALRLRQGANAY